MASIGINQIFAGDRPGSPGLSDPNYEGDEDLLFFNVNNLLAIRTNGQQGAVDFEQLARLFDGLARDRARERVADAARRSRSTRRRSSSSVTPRGGSTGRCCSPATSRRSGACSAARAR